MLRDLLKKKDKESYFFDTSGIKNFAWQRALTNKCNVRACEFDNGPRTVKGTYVCRGGKSSMGGFECDGTFKVSSSSARAGEVWVAKCKQEQVEEQRLDSMAAERALQQSPELRRAFAVSYETEQARIDELDSRRAFQSRSPQPQTAKRRQGGLGLSPAHVPSHAVQHSWDSPAKPLVRDQRPYYKQERDPSFEWGYVPAHDEVVGHPRKMITKHKSQYLGRSLPPPPALQTLPNPQPPRVRAKSSGSRGEVYPIPRTAPPALPQDSRVLQGQNRLRAKSSTSSRWGDPVQQQLSDKIGHNLKVVKPSSSSKSDRKKQKIVEITSDSMQVFLFWQS